jgi:hypothetical protein
VGNRKKNVCYVNLKKKLELEVLFRNCVRYRNPLKPVGQNKVK